MKSAPPAPRKPRKPKCGCSASAIAEAIRAKGGNLTSAAKTLGLTRASLAERVEKSDFLRSVWDECRAELVDYAETQLRNAIAKGEDWAIRYALDSSRASPRGWRKPPASAPSGETQPAAKPDAAAEKDAPPDPRTMTDEQLAAFNRAILGGSEA